MQGSIFILVLAKATWMDSVCFHIPGSSRSPDRMIKGKNINSFRSATSLFKIQFLHGENAVCFFAQEQPCHFISMSVLSVLGRLMSLFQDSCWQWKHHSWATIQTAAFYGCFSFEQKLWGSESNCEIARHLIQSLHAGWSRHDILPRVFSPYRPDLAILLVHRIRYTICCSCCSEKPLKICQEMTDTWLVFGSLSLRAQAEARNPPNDHPSPVQTAVSNQPRPRKTLIRWLRWLFRRNLGFFHGGMPKWMVYIGESQ